MYAIELHLNDGSKAYLVDYDSDSKEFTMTRSIYGAAKYNWFKVNILKGKLEADIEFIEQVEDSDCRISYIRVIDI